MIPNWILRLVKSSKFWLAFGAAVAALIAFFTGTIEAPQLVDALVALAMALMAAIAGEDMAAKFHGNHPSQKS